MKYLKKLRKRWQGWRFAKQNPVVAESRSYITLALKLGVENPVMRKRRRNP
ncbi:hypothetical protein [[Mannheimia] succiniciproducens]|nr:hypothetical protein [[Mannheimia] succiniciproducens]